MKGIPNTEGMNKEQLDKTVSDLIEEGDPLVAVDPIVAECAIRSMLFLQHIKRQFKQGHVKNGNNLVAAFESGLAALNDDDE